MLLLAGFPASAEIIDRILAVVNGAVITLSDVHAATQFGIGAERADDRAAIVGRLIDRRLMLTEVDRYAPAEPKREQIDAGVAAIRARFPSAAAFDAALAATGMTLEQLRRHTRDDLRLEAYLQQRFGFPIQPSEEDIRERRRAAIAEWVAALRRRADIIVLP